MELELRTLIQKLDLEDVETDKQIQTNQRTRKEIVIKTNVELKSLLKQVMEEEEAAVLFYPTFSIAWQTDKVYRISLREDLIGEGLDEEEALQSLQPFFENREIRKVTNDAKNFILRLHKLGVSINGLDFDTQIGAYLLEPTRSKYNVEQLIFDYTGIEVEIADASDILILTREMKKRMQEVNMEELYRKIEHPLIQVLADMELEGFKVDKQNAAGA